MFFDHTTQLTLMNLLLHTLLLYFQCIKNIVLNIVTTIYSIEYYNIVLPFNGVHNATYFIQEGLDVELFCGEDQQYSGDTKYFINNILIDKNSSNIEITNKTLRIYNIGIQQKASYSCKSALILPILPNSNEFYIWSIPLKISPISANISLSLSSSYISPVFGGMSRLVAEIKDTTYVEFFNIYWKTSINIPQITQENMKIFENNLEQTLLLVLSHGIIHIYWARFPFLIWANLDITETLESNRVQVSPIFENETCSVIYSPPDMTIYEGDSTTFECVTNLTPENIKWLHDGELILYDFNKIKIGNSALKINHVKRENIGKYTCVISCEGIELTSSSFLEINESYPLNSTGGGNTDIDITLINLTNFMLKTGESFSFQLNAPNFCASKAYRNGEVFVISDTSGSTLVSLNITNVTRNDTGLYQLMIFCGESVLSYTIPIIVEDKFETDQNLIEITRDDFSDYHTIQWSLPYFLSTVSLYQCLEIKSIKGFEDYTCFNNSLIPKMAVNRSLPYNHTFYMTLFIIDHDFNSHNISSMSYYVEIPAYNISMDDVTIYDVVWKIKDKKWVINWTLNNSIETEDVSYDVSCKKYNGDTVGKGVISHPPFTCGKIGIGVSMIEILVYYKKVEAKKYYFRNRFPSPNFLNTKWNLDRNNMQLLFINDRHNFIDSHLPILLRLQKLECINICNVQHEWVYQTSKILHEIRNLNFSSIYRLYYMRSDIEDFDTNSYIYFYTSPQEASKNVGSWFFLLSILFMLLFVILFLLLHKYILSKPNTLRKIEVVENWDDPYDYIFNVNFLPLDIANFGSVDLYLSR
ncbi:hypothetical protein HZS_203 [Henneguya salminicola]|nr:hypothetical protein HZS_203 [Henneguya salminicola]